MNYLFTIFLVSIFVPQICTAQFFHKKIDEKPFPGRIVLHSGEHLTGQIFYDSPYEVRMKSDNVYKIFKAEKVDFYEIFNGKKYKRFYSFPVEPLQSFVTNRNGLTHYEFLEHVMEGENYAFLTQRKKVSQLIYSTSDSPDLTPGAQITTFAPNIFSNEQHYETQELYFITKDGLVNFSNFNKEKASASTLNNMRNDLLLGFMGREHYEKVQSFMDKNYINLSRKRDVVEVLNHYENIVKGFPN